MYNWYVISMKTKNDKVIYLKEGKNNNLEWTFNRGESIWFENEYQAKDFANGYFINFDKWFIQEFEYKY